jgi:hypothetical protein
VRVCQHCGVRKADKGRRGLCWACGQSPEIRARYAGSTHPGATRSPVPTVARGALPARPTDTLPGSEERLRVLEERAARGENLNHPADARLDLR